jgi:hypothetical protein
LARLPLEILAGRIHDGDDSSPQKNSGVSSGRSVKAFR